MRNKSSTDDTDFKDFFVLLVPFVPLREKISTFRFQVSGLRFQVSGFKFPFSELEGSIPYLVIKEKLTTVTQLIHNIIVFRELAKKALEAIINLEFAHIRKTIFKSVSFLEKLLILRGT